MNLMLRWRGAGTDVHLFLSHIFVQRKVRFISSSKKPSTIYERCSFRRKKNTRRKKRIIFAQKQSLQKRMFQYNGMGLVSGLTQSLRKSGKKRCLYCVKPPLLFIFRQLCCGPELLCASMP